MKYEIRDRSCLPRRLPAPAPFRQQFSSTRCGARLARLLAAQQLADWGWARGGEYLEAAELVVGELAANAVTHGRVPGRDFLLTMTLVRPQESGSGTLRIEVADSRGERLPFPAPEPCPDGEHGRGLVLVSALAARWGVVPRSPSGKTVWAELPSPPG
ncbi:ATP-binding protein [Streptomyces sp. KMM 9044]|uniref:ATP-binding protein n=1 Tax=Streptomyces sp. KMM 9044 TaxID=2744474 RepID=UPI0021519694|nr:ATP-binding protein [Streptomyces sp. KMM 9044]WAX80125.1 ATP-binding protein [Streptomyces sp. KMM 9044]